VKSQAFSGQTRKGQFNQDCSDMKKPILAKTGMDTSIEELASRTDHRTLAIWAADCAERVLPYFEGSYPEDNRPREAIEALRTWVQTGVFRMADIRRDALAAHAAALEVEEYTPARSAARAAGQALATAHVPRHALAAAIYAATAVRDAATSSDAEAATVREREWQYEHLVELGNVGES
jgi:hypothetical protein